MRYNSSVRSKITGFGVKNNETCKRCENRKK